MKQKNRDRIQVIEIEGTVQQFQKQEKRNAHRIRLIWILAIIWVGLYFGSIMLHFDYYLAGSGMDMYNTPAHILKTIVDSMQRSIYLFSGGGDPKNIDMTYYRYLAIALAGAALSACGAVFQGTLKNVFAGPSTMGVMAGGSAGCMFYLLVFQGSVSAVGNTVMSYVWSQYSQQLCTLAGCFGGVSLILLVSTFVGRGRVSSTSMVIAGSVFTAVINNLMMAAQYVMIARNPDDGRIQDLRELMMGNFTNMGSLPALLMMGIPILICLVLLISNSAKLNVLSFGEEEAAVMGINVQRCKTLMLLAGAILTAMVVSFCGQIGFLGFMMPLIARKLVGPDLKKLLPISMMAGAILLTVIYDVALMLSLSSYLNTITSPIGCAVMLIVLFKKGGGQKNAEDQQSRASHGMGF